MSNWRQYYRLRNRARLGMLAIPLLLLVFVLVPPDLLARVLRFVHNLLRLPEGVVFFVVLGLGAIAVLAPILNWIQWRCPRCGNKFALPQGHAVVIVLGGMAWKLIADAPCSSCGQECGG